MAISKKIRTESFRKSIIRFLNQLNILEIKESMNISCHKFNKDINSAIKYFCGICWSKIKNNNKEAL